MTLGIIFIIVSILLIVIDLVGAVWFWGYKRTIELWEFYLYNILFIILSLTAFCLLILGAFKIE